MTPEDIIRTRVYEPPSHTEKAYGRDSDDSYMYEPESQPDYGRTERRLALAFLLLACFAAGLGIGLALP